MSIIRINEFKAREGTVLTLRLQTAILVAVVIFLPFIPITIRLSRTLWIYWDNMADPQANEPR